MDAVAKALAEPRRRAILTLLNRPDVPGSELTAGEIAANFDVSRPAISQHLRVLEDAELVAVRPEGTRRFYSARPETLNDLREWLDGFWSDGLARLKREVEQEQWRNNAAAKRRGEDNTDDRPPR